MSNISYLCFQILEIRNIYHSTSQCEGDLWTWPRTGREGPSISPPSTSPSNLTSNLMSSEASLMGEMDFPNWSQVRLTFPIILLISHCRPWWSGSEVSKWFCSADWTEVRDNDTLSNQEWKNKISQYFSGSKDLKSVVQTSEELLSRGRQRNRARSSTGW